MKRDVLETIHMLITDEHRGGVATVIAVRGSASARVGSKAVFDATGKNLAGWVGGGCAETYVGENVVAALEDRAPRIVHVDLDDEIFGLGIVCGGTMDVFVEPLLPPRQLSLPRLDPVEYETELRFLAESLGFKAAFDGATKTVNGLADLYLVLAGAIAMSRGQQMVSLRRVKQLPVHFVEGPRRRPDSVLLVGQTRITETLARLFTQLGVPTTLIAQEVNQDALPGAVRCTCGAEHPQSLEVPAGAAVVVGSHLPTDPHYVRTALDAGSPYVGMIGSRKRALEVLGVLGIDEGDHVKRPLYVPAGVDIAAETPEEIALSIVVEILLLPEGSR